MEIFANLSPDKKVEALLAAAKQPVTKLQIMEWLGAENDVSGIDEVLSRFAVASESDEQKYWVELSKQEEVIRQLDVDRKSVHRRISSVALEKIKLKHK